MPVGVTILTRRSGGRFVHKCRRRSLGKEWSRISSFGGRAEGKNSFHKEKKHRILRQSDHARCHRKRDISVTEFRYTKIIKKMAVRTRAKTDEKATAFEMKSLRECNGAP